MTITIAGKELGIRFNNHAIEKLIGVKGNMTNSAWVISIVWGGICGYEFAKQIDEQITFEDVIHYVDNSFEDDIAKQKIMDVQKEFYESQEYTKLIKKGKEAIEADEQKKSLLSMTSTSTPGDL